MARRKCKTVGYTYLAIVIKTSLTIARRVHDLKTISFPNISTGIFGYPKHRAAVIAVETVKPIFGKTQWYQSSCFCLF